MQDLVGDCNPLPFTLNEMGSCWRAFRKEGTCSGWCFCAENMPSQGRNEWKQGGPLGSNLPLYSIINK